MRSVAVRWSLDERIDLLLLGWVGDGRPHTRRRLFDFAMRSSSDIRYIAGAWECGCHMMDLCY